ncbi:MAG TPA: hypothetical protein VF607_09045 [Verrucomicrobiae bacterium]
MVNLLTGSFVVPACGIKARLGDSPACQCGSHLRLAPSQNLSPPHLKQFEYTPKTKSSVEVGLRCGNRTRNTTEDSRGSLTVSYHLFGFDAIIDRKRPSEK